MKIRLTREEATCLWSLLDAAYIGGPLCDLSRRMFRHDEDIPLPEFDGRLEYMTEIALLSLEKQLGGKERSDGDWSMEITDVEARMLRRVFV